MATQGERRTLTRQALLAAAARLFAEQGVDNSSVDAIARAAGRTSGALYDHFGSKEGLLFALVDGWVDDVAVVIAAELVNAPTRPEKVAALWRNFADPAVGDGRWIALEHELWSFASRSDDARARLAERYRRAFAAMDADAMWAGDDADTVAPAVVGTLLGLEMVRRVAPDAMSDDLAVTTLLGVLDAHAATGRIDTNQIDTNRIDISQIDTRGT